MDIISVIRDEEERDLFFIQEELRDMEHLDMDELRQWAHRLYGKADESTPEEAIALSCIIQTGIAEHLARIAEALEKISKRLEES